jgi:hypothetical protein
VRLVFLLFLSLNAGYFFWQSGYFRESATQPEREAGVPKGVASLTLLRERGLGGVEASNRPVIQTPSPPAETVPDAPLPEITKPAAPVVDVAPVTERPAPEPKAPEPAVMACFTFGPFDKEETVATAFEAISAAGGNVKRRQVEQRTPRAYWVYLAPTESYADAQEKVRELRNKGISDLFIMGKGEKQNAISLGLFSSKVTADQRYEEVMALGMHPIAETQYRVTMIEWLDIEVDSSRITTIATITAIADEYKTANLSQRSCE